MTNRRRFTAEFKARVALEALRGDKTIQQIAAKHKVHPNQVSAWKRQAVDGLGEVFSNGANRACRDHESEVRDLHAKIGELTVERDFLGNYIHDYPKSWRPTGEAAMITAWSGSALWPLSSALSRLAWGAGKCT